jgi:hypothetical protein
MDQQVEHWEHEAVSYVLHFDSHKSSVNVSDVVKKQNRVA